MKLLNLYKLSWLLNTLSEKESELAEQNIYVHLLGNRSNYTEMSFESFLNQYSFKIDEDEIIVFNQDGIPYEDYYNDDFSYIPLSLLSFGKKELETWMDDEIEKQLAQQELEKGEQKEKLKDQIKRLQTQLDNL